MGRTHSANSKGMTAETESHRKVANGDSRVGEEALDSAHGIDSQTTTYALVTHF